jgi:hypothetical protein
LLLQSNPFEVGALLAVELTAIALFAGGSPAQTMNVCKLVLGQTKRCNAVVCPAAKLL